MYSLLAFLSLLSVHLYLLALERNRWYLWLAYLLTTGLSMYVHILAVLLVPFQVLFYLISWPRYRGARKAWLMAMGSLVLPYLPLARWEIPILLSSFITGHKFYTFPQIFTVLLFSFGLNSAPYRVSPQQVLSFSYSWWGFFSIERREKERRFLWGASLRW